MTICLLGLKFANTVAFLYCICVLIEETCIGVDLRFIIHCSVLGIVYLILSDIGETYPVLSCILKLIALLGHVRLYYHNKKNSVFRGVFVIYVLWEMLYVVIAFITFPCIYLWGVELNKSNLDFIIICIVGIHAVICSCITFMLLKKKQKIIQSFSHSAQMGIVICCMILEFAILEFRSMIYHPREIRSYKILLAGIVLSCIVIVLWVLDKREEQKKIRELTSYAHKTREIIPSVGRALKRLKDMSDQLEDAERLLEELQSICQTDMWEVYREVSNIKTFDSTGCFVLDEQLGRYLEEACEHDFQLDIIVRAPVDELLLTKQINRYQLLQLVGDLYRNAYKVVMKRNGGGHILICFGYNMKGFYEISVYDNGAPFPAYVLKHLGERGITTDGTGHGMADIFAVLEDGRGSFDLNQNLPESSIFTKGICIIFDGQARVEIRNR